MPDSDFVAALRALHAAGVEFIVVGGVAAVLNGAPVNTFDLDIVPSRTGENISKLMNVLEAADAAASRFASAGHHKLITRFGPLDVLGTIGSGMAFEDLLPHSIEMDLGDGLRVRVLDLPTLVTLKEQLGGEKDRAVLPVLRRTLEEKNRSAQ